MTALLRVEGLEVAYEIAGRAKTVVHGVDLELAEGEVLALVGESGSGKTTTGQAILGLLPGNGRVTGGRIHFRDQVLTDLSPAGWRDVRGRAIALIPQDPTVSLDPVRRVGHQVDDVLRLHTSLDAAARLARVHELFELVGFTDVERRYRQYPHELSGGMRQRVLIAAAVAAEPDLIIADEPTSGLDATVQKQVLDLIDDLRARLGTAVVLVTHDLGVAADRSDRIGVMQDGRLVEVRPTAEMIADPRHEYTRRLLGAVTSRLERGRERVAPASGREVVVRVEGLRKEYDGFVAVDDSSFEVRRGETFSIVGESGSGKSTTARVLTGLTPATSGRVELLGTDVTRLGPRAFRPLRKDIQIVYQNPYSSFDPRFGVYDVVDEPLRATIGSGGPRWGRGGKRPHEDQVVAALEAAALPADFVNRHPRELSGGQRQRVAIARALVCEPQVVVLDEPISALDVSVAAQILELLGQLQAERDLTYVFISHDLAVVRAISDHVAVMQEGRIVEAGAIGDVFDRPQHAYTRDLLAAIAGRDLVTSR